MERVAGSWAPTGSPGSVPGRPTRPGDDPTPAGRFTFAVNTPKFYQAPKYGDPDVIARDLRQLGARVARHPGRVQLYFDELVDSCGGAGCTLTEADLVEDAFYRAARRSEAYVYLGELARTLRDTGEGLRLIFTLFHLGGGAPPQWGTGDLPTTPSNTPYGNPLELRWAASLKGTTIEDGLTGEIHPFEVAGASDAWNLYTIDPRNPFKREIYRRMGVGIGRALAEVADDIAPYLAGVEIFNEIEVYHSVTESDGEVHADGEGWAWLYYYVAAGLLSECDWLPLWIPGIASYADDATDYVRTYPGKREFLDRFLGGLQRVGTEIPLGLTLEQLCEGVDYHYYHRRSADAQSLLYLPLEIADLRGVFAVYDFQSARLTVIESGVNVVCDASEPVPTMAWESGCEGSEGWAPYPEYHLPSGVTPDYRPALYVRRGARVLRLLDAAPANAWQGIQVYQRLVRVLGQARAARVVHPHLDGVTRDTLPTDLDSGALKGADLVWVVEVDGARFVSGKGDPSTMTGAGASWWAYVVFIDDTALAATALPTSATVRFRASSSSGAVGGVYRVPLAPAGSTLMSGSPAGEFPGQTWTVAPTELLDADPPTDPLLPILPTWTVEVLRGGWPALLLCPRRLLAVAVEAT